MYAALWLLYFRYGAPVPIVQEAEWAPGRVWTGVEKRKFLGLTGI